MVFNRRSVCAGVWVDVVHATRQLRRRPAHTLAVVACLAAGLTVSIATFSVFTSYLFGEHPGVTNRRQLLSVHLSYIEPAGSAGAGNRRISANTLSLEDFTLLRDAGPALGSLAVEGPLRMAAVGSHGPIGLNGAFVSGNYFEVLGTLALAGRLLVVADEAVNAAPVAVVSEHFWRTQLDSRPDAIGATMLIAGRSFAIVGVAPPRFNGFTPQDVGEDPGRGLQLWLPLTHAAGWPNAPAADHAWLECFGRLRSGASADTARSHLAVVMKRLETAYPTTRASASAALVESYGFGPNTTTSEILMIIGAIMGLPFTVLAIGCANVANLQLARMTERTRELGVRLSFGASRWQLIRLLTIETAALAAAALALSAIATVALVRTVDAVFPIYTSPDPLVVLLSLLLTLGITFGAGLAPAWFAMRGPHAERLQRTSHGGGIGHSRLRSILIVVQVVLCLLILSASGMFFRSVQSMQLEVPPALQSQVVVEFDPAQSGGSSAELQRFGESLHSRMEAVPGVTGVARSRSSMVRYPAQNDGGLQRSTALLEITPSFLDVMDIAILAGRALTEKDGPNVAVVSARLADLLGPQDSVLGRTLSIDDGTPAGRLLEVVGVVADSRTRPTYAGGRANAVMYVPFAANGGSFVMRIKARNVNVVSNELRTIVHHLDPTMPWLSLRTSEEIYLTAAGPLGYAALATSVLGLIGLSLAVTGLYAVMAYMVQLRRHEIGIRMAIGANRGHITSMMLRQALRLVFVGGAIGMGLALPLGFVLRAIVIGNIAPFDPVVLAPPFLLLLVTALVAAVLPAGRAAGIDPLSILRQD